MWYVLMYMNVEDRELGRIEALADPIYFLFCYFSKFLRSAAYKEDIYTLMNNYQP